MGLIVVFQDPESQVNQLWKLDDVTIISILKPRGKQIYMLVKLYKLVQSNFSGSNTFGTMKISLRQG